METIPLAPTGKRSRLNCCPSQENDGLRVIVFCFGVLCICVTIALVISIYFGEPEVIPSGAVATDSLQCSEIGVEILKKGGNAVDAAIASVLCLSVIAPHITSVGGGGALIVLNYMSAKAPTVINFQDAAAGSFPGAQTLPNGTTAGIPGLLSGLWQAHRKFGRHNWADLVSPAINMCQRGVNVSSQLAIAVKNLPDDSPLRKSQLFFPNGIPLAENQVIRQPALATFLTSVAQNGIHEFYNGSAGARLIDFMNKRVSAEWKMEDLQNYEARIEPAVSTVFGGTTLYTSSAPTAGPQLLSLVNLLAGLGLGQQDQLKLMYAHELVEAIRITESQITKLGDPLLDENVKVVVNNMVNRTIADEVRKQILPDTILPDTNVPALPEVTASVVSVMDNEENYVSIVSGLNSLFGSHLETPDGYLMNSAMTNFYPQDPSAPLPNSGGRPSQRPLQGIVPVVATESSGRCGVRFVAGASDATLLGQVVMNLLQFNQSVADAVRSARIHAQPQTHKLMLEDAYQIKLPETLVKALNDMGHQVIVRPPPYPSINAVLKNGDALFSESDGRGGGISVKYGS